MAEPEKVVFIVDDDEGIRDALELLLQSLGLVTRAFASGQEFLDQHRVSDRGCVVMDVDLPGVGGLQIHEILKRRRSSLPIIFITGHSDIPMAVDSMRKGAVDFIRKPFSEEAILKSIRQALAKDAGAEEC